jgi:hypothetical protein
MKYITFLVLCLLAISLSGQSNGYNIDKAVDKTSKLFNLDQSQKSAYKDILAKKIESYKAANITKDRDVDAIADADDAYDTSFLAILNDDQKELFKAQKVLTDSAKNRLVGKPNAKPTAIKPKKEIK